MEIKEHMEVIGADGMHIAADLVKLRGRGSARFPGRRSIK